MFDKEVKFTESHKVLLYLVAINAVVDFILTVLK